MSFQEEVDGEIEKLRGASRSDLDRLRETQTQKRVDWFDAVKDRLELDLADPLTAGYEVLLARLALAPDQVPIVERSRDRIIFRSANPCPTLEACRRLGLDTRQICRAISHGSTDALLKRLDPRLEFKRNYDRLRPYADDCEEMIVLKQQTPPQE